MRPKPLYHCYTVKAAIHRIGNSQGVILPKPLLRQVGLTEGEVELTVERDAIVLRKPKRNVREGWAEDSKKLAAAGDDTLVWPDFPNKGDDELIW